MKLISLSSGSSGNCLYVEHENTKLLIDAGLSGNRIQQLMADASIDPSTLSAILVTHEHEDHIGGVPFVLDQLPPFPIYATPLTAAFTNEKLRDFGINQRVVEVKFKKDFKLGAFMVRFLHITHSVMDTSNIFIKRFNFLKPSLICLNFWIFS